MELNKVYCENCLDTMSRMDDKFIDLTVTSPPYDNLREYNGYDFDFNLIANELYRVTKIGGVVVWVVSDQTINGSESGTSFKQALYFKDIGFNLHDTMIYEQAGTGAKGSNLSYWQSFEYMFIFSKGKPNAINLISDVVNTVAGKKRSTSRKANLIKSRQERGNIFGPDFSRRPNIWRYAVGGNGTEHPAPFPERLAADHIYSWSNEGDIVYDPFMGSGTTAAACLRLNRNYIGSEISADYVELIRKRLSPIINQTKLY